MKILATLLLSYVFTITADSLDEGTTLPDIKHLSFEEVSDRGKRTLGIDKNIKKDIELKTKLGTVLKISKTITYNDGGGLTLLPTLLDSIATNKNRVISQLQKKTLHSHKLKTHRPITEATDDMVSSTFNNSKPVEYEIVPVKIIQKKSHNLVSKSTIDEPQVQTVDDVVSSTLNNNQSGKYELVPIRIINAKRHHHQLNKSKTDQPYEETVDDVMSGSLNDNDTVEYELIPVEIVQSKGQPSQVDNSKTGHDNVGNVDDIVSDTYNNSKPIEFELLPVRIIQPQAHQHGRLRKNAKLLKLKKSLFMSKLENCQ